MHSRENLLQFVHGCVLSHLSFLRRHSRHDVIIRLRRRTLEADEVLGFALAPSRDAWTSSELDSPIVEDMFDRKRCFAQRDFKDVVLKTTQSVPGMTLRGDCTRRRARSYHARSQYATRK